MKNCLIITDMQNDFCPGGALAVAEEDRRKHQAALRPELPASEFRREGKMLQKLRAISSCHPQAAHLQGEAVHLESLPGLFVLIEEAPSES